MKTDYCLGISIEPSFIAFHICSASTKKIIACFTENLTQLNSCTLNSNDVLRFDDIAETERCVKSVLDSIIEKYDDILMITVAGHSEGIVYTNKNGNAVSSDVNASFSEGNAVCREIDDISGKFVHRHSGFAIHYQNLKSGSVPESAVSCCYIADYIVMKLAGLKRPLIHSSEAAYMGLYDITNRKFSGNAFADLNIDKNFIPDTTDSYTVCGYYKGIPISVAIGEYTASFLGASGTETDNTLIKLSDINLSNCNFNDSVKNFGSIYGKAMVLQLTAKPVFINGIDVFPFLDGKYLLAGVHKPGLQIIAHIIKLFEQIRFDSERKTETIQEFFERLVNEVSKASIENVPKITTHFNDETYEYSYSIENIPLENPSMIGLLIGAADSIIYDLDDILLKINRFFARTPQYTVLSGGTKLNTELFSSSFVKASFGKTKIRLYTGKNDMADGACMFALRCLGH